MEPSWTASASRWPLPSTFRRYTLIHTLSRSFLLNGGKLELRVLDLCPDVEHAQHALGQLLGNSGDYPVTGMDLGWEAQLAPLPKHPEAHCPLACALTVAERARQLHYYAMRRKLSCRPDCCPLTHLKRQMYPGLSPRRNATGVTLLNKKCLRPACLRLTAIIEFWADSRPCQRNSIHRRHSN